jgi:two-component system sensor histidine kinase YesM
VECYLYIQKVRYEEKLSYAIDCPPELLAHRVNKLILQPLVENAIYHGIKLKQGAGHVWISVRAAGDALHIEIEDDGAGMPPERCETLNAALRAGSGASPDRGYGIFNVNDRIRLSHGETFGLTYRVNGHGGVTVTILFPVLQSLKAG